MNIVAWWMVNSHKYSIGSFIMCFQSTYIHISSKFLIHLKALEMTWLLRVEGIRNIRFATSIGINRTKFDWWHGLCSLFSTAEVYGLFEYTCSLRKSIQKSNLAGPYGTTLAASSNCSMRSVACNAVLWKLYFELTTQNSPSCGLRKVKLL